MLSIIGAVVSLTLEGSAYYDASYAISSMCLIMSTSLKTLLVFQRWEFYGWKPIIYTCDHRSVWLNCISFIILYQKAWAILTVLGVTFPRCWFIPKQVSQVPSHVLGESRDKNELSCPKLQKLCSLVISKVAFLICNCAFLFTKNCSEEMMGRNKSLNNGQILSFMTSWRGVCLNKKTYPR